MSDLQEVVNADIVSAEDSSMAVVDRDSAAPQGVPCGACGCPVEAGERFCPACGSPQSEQAEQARDAEEAASAFFRCQNCGCEMSADLQQRSYVCPFCNSTYVAEFSPSLTDRQRPEFVIGFAVTPDQAREKFFQWIGQNSWFRPGDLRAAQIVDKQKGIYLPFWTFSMLAESQWEGAIGEYWYRTETYTERDSKGKMVTKTRQVRETEWWPLSGRHHRYYSGHLVSGSRGLQQREADQLLPFQLPAMKRYQPYFVAGWLCEEYSLARDEALALCQQEFFRHEQSHVAAFLPGDTHRSLNVQTQFSHVNSDLCLLPIYMLTYRYKDRLFRFLVNGQTGKVAGEKPVSWNRIWAAIGGGVVALVLLILLLMLLSGL